MPQISSVTAFKGERLLASGNWDDVTLAVKAAQAAGDHLPVLLFDDATGRQVEIDPRSGALASAGRAEADAERKGPGRPRLGVVAREITLLPRHWEWLARQPGGASVAIRKLVDEARSVHADADRIREAREAADRFMLAMLGNQPGCEEASRALYAGNGERFKTLTENWPADLRDYLRRVAAPAFSTSA
jgi:hypothetical protein